MRKAGILMPIASLPSPYGIGEFGSGCHKFIDYLKECGASIWQILPLNPLGYGNSPYQPYSSYAGDELYISLEVLHLEGLLLESPIPFPGDADCIDYQAVRAYKTSYYQQAFRNFVPDEAYHTFIKQEWVYPYAVFLTFKKKNAMKCWNEWPALYQNWIRDHKFNEHVYEEEIRYEMFLQYMFFKQWKSVKQYANDSGIEIMGDLPFYVGIDSLDVWANQENFLFGADGKPSFIAGVPPDYFSETGQRWGNPIYDWDYMKKDHFSFWFKRLAHSTQLFDIVRIDHFRAFDTYWKIPSSCETAIDGEWAEAPGYQFFDELREAMPDINIVVEDLGDMREEVYELRDHYHFAGMKIVQFEFDPKGLKREFIDRENMLIYTGTHDNQTIRGWFDASSEEDRVAADLFLKLHGYAGDSITNRFIRFVFHNIADYALVSVQDILNLGDESRLNIPGTLGSPNWEWRLPGMNALLCTTDFMRHVIYESGRHPGYSIFLPADIRTDLNSLISRYCAGKDIAECTKQELHSALLAFGEEYAETCSCCKDGRSAEYAAEFLLERLRIQNLISKELYRDLYAEFYPEPAASEQIEQTNESATKSDVPTTSDIR